MTLAQTKSNPNPLPDGLARALIAESSEINAYRSLLARLSPDLASVSEHQHTLRLLCPAAPRAFIVNRVLGWGVQAPAHESALDEWVQLHGAAGLSLGVEWSDLAQPSDSRDWFRARRMRRLSSSQILLSPCSPVSNRYERWSQSRSIRIEAVGPQQSDTVARLCSENFPIPKAIGEILRLGSRGAGWGRWVAFDGDLPVAASLSYHEGDSMWLGWTCVSPSHRAGGAVYAGIVSRQLDEAALLGLRWVTGETDKHTPKAPSPAHLFMKRLGFWEAYERDFYALAAKPDIKPEVKP
jgi:hypothetical protein